ncbi:hypothetical protein [Fusobacterium nucleatum]|uniref:hypothetical protein n=1 Tax=Fusobacterium nucleatum TaxID=851 RepID=UPI00235FD155|nr:hypothetical protein [Fusobacterium nucleatum]WDA46449.1 hypothetical protein PSR67_02745 [Fusobacterium nucleatum]
MKKILIALMLVIGMFAYGDTMSDEIKKFYDSVEADTYIPDVQAVEDILREPYYDYNSPFAPESDKVISYGDFIIQISTWYAYETIYNFDVDKMKKEKPSIDKYFKDFHYKAVMDGGLVVLWCIPSAHTLGMIDMTSGDIWIYGVDTGMASYTKGLYSMAPLHMRYSDFMYGLDRTNEELYKVICEINDVKI